MKQKNSVHSLKTNICGEQEQTNNAKYELIFG